MLPDYLDLVDESTKENYLRVLGHMAVADGRIADEEFRALEAWMGFSELSEETKRELRSEWNDPKPLDDVLEQLDSAGLRLALRDAMLLAASDGEYNDTEVDLIERLIADIGLDDDNVQALYDWVTEYWTVLAKGRSLLGLTMPGDEALLES